MDELQKDDNEKLKDLIARVHLYVELNEGGRVSRKAMATRLGVQYRTYTEYRRGVNSPLSMKVILNFLSMLKEEQLSDVMSMWRSKDAL